LVVIRAIALCLPVLMRLKGCEETVDALGEAIVDDALVLKSADLMAAVLAFLVDLGLFGADEGFLVDIGVHFDVAIVGELEGVLLESQKLQQQCIRICNTYPLAVVNHHLGRAMSRAKVCGTLLVFETAVCLG
jgi:hypothetical protein